MDQHSTWKVMQWMNEGGWVMWGLLAFSIVAMATAVERSIKLRRSRLDFESFSRRLHRALVREGSVAEAARICGQAPGPVARVAGAALRRFERTPGQLEQIMERQARREQRSLYRGLGVLATVATTAPLLGFLGTVTGMMVSFEALATHGISNPAMVAMGIKEALTTTAAGLMVAVPVQVVHNSLSGRVERLTGDMESVGNLLLEMREQMG